MKVTVIGLGLIGGSIAIDLRKAGLATELVGVDLNSEHARKAVELGLVDKIQTEDKALHQADIVILAIPVNAMCQLLPAVLDAVKSTAVVIDAGSTKSLICRAVANHPKREQLVAAHPIAGTENSGPEAAFSGLFKNKTNIICEKEKSSDHSLEVSMRVFNALGLHTIFMEAEEHDKHVAYVSHLSHVSSFLLGQTVLDIEKDEKNIFALAGSGFASTVRLAKSSPEMWAPIFGVYHALATLPLPPDEARYKGTEPHHVKRQRNTKSTRWYRTENKKSERGTICRKTKISIYIVNL
jgi:prephenate dehydrogenase